jgi:two-component system LytT family response regulator
MSSKQLFIKYLGKHIPVNMADICYCEASGCNSIIHLTNHEVIAITKTLKYLESVLDKEIFIRIRRNTLINRYQVKEILDYKQPVVVLKNGKEIVVSFRKKKN